MKTEIQFYAGEGISGNGINYLYGENKDIRIFAGIIVPEGASEVYGYIDLKDAIVAKLIELNVDPNGFDFWYDGQEQFLEEDARTGEDVCVEIDMDL